MKSACFALLFAVLALSGADARRMQSSHGGSSYSTSAPKAAASSPTYETVGAALTAASNAPILSTLLAAVTAADLSIPEDATWTIFTPTNDAFADAVIKEKTGVTAAQLLEPENKDALVKLLSYHVVPAAAVASTQLKDGQKVETLLEGAAPLTVNLEGGKVFIKDAEVVTADIKAGKSIIHVINKVLIPAALVKA